MRKALFCFMIGCGVLAMVPVRSSLAADPVDKAKEEAAIMKNAEAFVAAFNKGDAKSVAAFFTSEADMVDQEGHHFKGRKAIEEVYQRFFEEVKGAKLYLRIGSLRVAKGDLALEDGESEVVQADGPPLAGRYSVVWVKADGKWMMESVREAVATPPNNTEHLRDLAFLIGDWTEDVEKGGSSTASYHWDEHQNFIINNFDVAMKDISVAGGTQWIGWDASAKKARAWSFLFNGGFAESSFAKDGDNKWKVTINATQRDGSKVTATNILKKVDSDHLSFQFVDRKVDGKPLPDDKEIKFKRMK
jgi:uncharacterized protein (TIGR02246 family)